MSENKLAEARNERNKEILAICKEYQDSINETRLSEAIEYFEYTSDTLPFFSADTRKNYLTYLKVLIEESVLDPSWTIGYVNTNQIVILSMLRLLSHLSDSRQQNRLNALVAFMKFMNLPPRIYEE